MLSLAAQEGLQRPGPKNLVRYENIKFGDLNQVIQKLVILFIISGIRFIYQEDQK